MATKQEIDQHLKIALNEIGEIRPKYDRSVREWIFSHPLYPVEYAGKKKEEVIQNYPKYLREFIKHRLNNQIEKLVEKKTKGRGGLRPGAGRPKGTKKEPTKTIRLSLHMAQWIKQHESDIQEVMAGKKKIVPAKRNNNYAA